MNTPTTTTEPASAVPAEYTRRPRRGRRVAARARGARFLTSSRGIGSSSIGSRPRAGGWASSSRSSSRRRPLDEVAAARAFADDLKLPAPKAGEGRGGARGGTSRTRRSPSRRCRPRAQELFAAAGPFVGQAARRVADRAGRARARRDRERARRYPRAGRERRRPSRGGTAWLVGAGMNAHAPAFTGRPSRTFAELEQHVDHAAHELELARGKRAEFAKSREAELEWRAQNARDKRAGRAATSGAAGRRRTRAPRRSSRDRPTPHCLQSSHDREMHLDVYDPLAVGDTVEMIRGNGPREGDRIGTATVTGFEAHRRTRYSVPALFRVRDDTSRRSGAGSRPARRGGCRRPRADPRGQNLAAVLRTRAVRGLALGELALVCPAARRTRYVLDALRRRPSVFARVGAGAGTRWLHYKTGRTACGTGSERRRAAVA